MAFLSCLLFCAWCFAEELIRLEPVNAIPSAITCSGITEASKAAACNALPGCTWLADSSQCTLDACWKAGDSAQTAPSDVTTTCTCPDTYLTTEQGSGSSWDCGVWSNAGYPPHGGGGGKDFYCQRDVAGKYLVDECSYQYLRNGSCTAPYCILIDYPAAPEGGKICKKVPECAVSKVSTNPPNGIRLATNATIAACLTARYVLGETTACNQNPRFYLSGSNCVEDTSFAPVADQDSPTCTGSLVVKQVKGVVSNAVTTLSYCASPNNPVLNTCWNLANTTVPTNPPANQCPINPDPTGTKLNENTALCTGDCFVQTISSYYYGFTKICVNNDSAAGHSSILVVPSLIALLLLAFFL